MAGELCTSGQAYRFCQCLRTVTDKCTYNVVFLFCPVGVDDTTVLGKLH